MFTSDDGNGILLKRVGGAHRRKLAACVWRQRSDTGVPNEKTKIRQKNAVSLINGMCGLAETVLWTKACVHRLGRNRYGQMERQVTHQR